MTSKVSLDNSNKVSFTEVIYKDNEFVSRLYAVIRVLQNQWVYAQELLNSNSSVCGLSCSSAFNFSNKTPKSQINIINSLVQGLFFVESRGFHYKKCLGHDIRVNSEKLTKKKANAFIDKLVKNFPENAGVIPGSVQGYKKETSGFLKRYDVRLKFKHYDNFGNCDSPVSEGTVEEEIFVCDVLRDFEKLLLDNSVDLEKEYSKLFQKVFLKL